MERYSLTLQVLRVLLVNKGGQVSTIIKDHVEGLATGEGVEGLLNAPRVLLLGLALPCKNRDTSCSNAVERI